MGTYQRDILNMISRPSCSLFWLSCPRTRGGRERKKKRETGVKECMVLSSVHGLRRNGQESDDSLGSHYGTQMIGIQ